MKKNIFAVGLFVLIFTPFCYADDMQMDDFSATVALTAEAGEIAALELPEFVYRHLERADYHDIRVFDEAGRVVPSEIRLTQQTKIDTPPPQAAPFFPWRNTTGSSPSKTNITVNTNGAVVSITSDAINANESALSYLVDASGFDDPIESLELDCGVAPFNSAVSLQYSNDLTTWKKNGTTTIARYGNVNHTNISVPKEKAPYLLLVFERGAPALNGALAVFAEIRQTKAATRQTVISGVLSKDRRNVMYDTQGYYPITTIDFLLPENDSIDVDVFFKQNETGMMQATLDQARAMQTTLDEEWIFFARASLFRTGSGESRRKNDPISIKNSGSGASISRYNAPHWRIEAGQTLAAPPELQITWQALRIVFLARGTGPWTLAYGNSLCEDSAQVLPPVDETDIKAAFLSGNETRRPAASTASGDNRLLWGVLIAAVLVITALAIYCIRKIGRPAQ
jgi:hypothetical protein